MLETQCLLAGVLVVCAAVGFLAILLRVPVLCLCAGWIAAMIIVDVFLRLAQLLKPHGAAATISPNSKPRRPSKKGPSQKD